MEKLLKLTLNDGGYQKDIVVSEDTVSDIAYRLYGLETIENYFEDRLEDEGEYPNQIEWHEFLEFMFEGVFDWKLTILNSDKYEELDFNNLNHMAAIGFTD